MYKLVAIDLDGTLLNNYGIVTQESKNIIDEVLKKGVEVVIASGRPIDSVKTIANEIRANRYCISGNGSLLYDLKKQKILYEKSIPKQKVLEMIKICEENSIFYSIYTSTTILSKNLNYNVLYYHKENLTKKEDKKTHINIVQNMYDYVKDLEDEKFLKITVCDHDQFVFKSIIRKFREIENIEVLDVAHISRKVIRQGTEEVPIEYYYTEISAENVDKWGAISYLAKELSISPEDIIAIGDNVNDIKMIKNAGLGIAMEKSSPKVIETADYVTQDNNEEGVANALQRFILK